MTGLDKLRLRHDESCMAWAMARNMLGCEAPVTRVLEARCGALLTAIATVAGDYGAPAEEDAEGGAEDPEEEEAAENGAAQPQPHPCRPAQAAYDADPERATRRQIRLWARGPGGMTDVSEYGPIGPPAMARINARRAALGLPDFFMEADKP